MTPKAIAPANWSWYAWAGFLVVLYVAISIVGWNRTLIPDEIRVLLLAAQPAGEIVEYARKDIVHPPLTYLLQRGWLNIFGHTDSAAKAWALLMGSLTIFTFTYLARRVTSYWWLLALFFCTPYFRIGSSVNLVRMYGLLLLLVVVAILLWDQWKKTPGPGWLAAWVITMTMAIYSHGTGLLLIPAFVITNWLCGPRKWTFTIAGVIPVLALSLWIIITLPDYLTRDVFFTNAGWGNESPNRTLIKLPFYFLSGEDAGGGSPVPPLWTMGDFRMLAITLFLLNLVLLLPAWKKISQLRWSLRESDDTTRWLITSALLCGIPIGMLYIFSLLVFSALQARFVLLATPAYWMLLVLLGELGGRMNRAIFLGIFVPWILLGTGLTLVQNLSPSWARQGTQFVATEMGASDLILVDKHMPLGWQVYWEWTHRLERDSRIEILSSVDVPPYMRTIKPDTPLDQLNVENTARVWYFYSKNWYQRRRAVAPVTEFLTKHGFVVDEDAVAGLSWRQSQEKSPYMIVFTKVDSALATQDTAQ